VKFSELRFEMSEWGDNNVMFCYVLVSYREMISISGMLHIPRKVVDTFRKNCAKLSGQDKPNSIATV
jgi:hypothetical protein